jgi:hypothetical protein
MSLWDQINLLTAGDAAKLAVSVNESETKALFIKMKKSYAKALGEIFTKHYETGHPELKQTDFKPKYQSIDAPLPEEHLYSRALEMQSKVLFRPNASAASCAFFHDWYRDENGEDGAFSSNFDAQEFSRDELHRWLTFHEIESAYQFKKIETSAADDAPTQQTIDINLLATPEELSKVFGVWGLKTGWFNEPSKHPWLLAARKRLGRGGNKSVAPLYCPYEVMIGLTTQTRPRYGVRPSQEKGFELLGRFFPAVYEKFEIMAPDDDQS